MQPPPNWPELTLALALAVIAGYFAADIVARLAERVLRAAIPDELEPRLVDGPRRVVRITIFVVVTLTLAFPALRVAGYDGAVGADPEAIGRWLMHGGLRVAIVVLAAYLVIRIGNGAARRFELEMSRGTGLDVIERTKRAQTLSRLLTTSTSIVVGGIAVLMVLRELNVDVTPVLTGAGIAGLAIGFGAQTLVRDVISGFFFILEDQVRVGDVAVVNGQGGLVEQLNLRTIVLRDYEGTVHVFPNGEIKSLANRSKDFSYYVIDLGMEYGEDPARVVQAVRDAAATMMDDPVHKANILEPIDIAGVDAFADSQVTIKARIKTVPLKQWEVGRELRRRIYLTLRERKIAIPYRQLVVHLDHPEALRPPDPPAV